MGSRASDNKIAELNQDTALQNTSHTFLGKMRELWIEAKRIFLEQNGVPEESEEETGIIEVSSTVRNQEEVDFADEIAETIDGYGNGEVRTREEIESDGMQIGVADVYLPDENKVVVCGSVEEMLTVIGRTFAFKQAGYDVGLGIHNPEDVGRSEMKILNEVDIDLIIPRDESPEVVTEYSSFRTTYDSDDFETESLLFWR